MKNSIVNGKRLVYEIRNTLGNIFIIIFGVFFPMVMSIVVGKIFTGNVSEEAKSTAYAGIFITMSLIIPMATILIGYAATFSQELEKNMPLRLELFGYTRKSQLVLKMLSNLIVMTVSLILFTIVDFSFLDIPKPSPKAVVILVISLYLLACIFFVFAHGLAMFFKKFGPTYAITMAFYFITMMLCGMFGVMPSQLPSGLRFIAYLFPMSYISEDFVTFWEGGSYNFAPFIQSMIFFAGLSGIVLFIGLRKKR